MAGVKPLVMVVDGDVRGLQTAARAASAVTAEIAERIAAGEADARASLEDYGLAFDKLANVSKTAMSQMSANINAEFRNMAREAERAAKLGQDFNPVAGFTSQGQQQFADNMRKSAAEALRVATALDKVAAAGGPLAEAQRASAANALLNAKNFALEADAAELVADELRKVEVASGVVEAGGQKVVGTTGAMRAGFQQAGFQVSDFIVQVSGGTSAIRAASLQAPQLIQAMALMGGGAEGSTSKFARFATFMGGPWGAAITVGVSLLGLLATSLLDSEDAAEKAEDKTYDFAQSLDFLALKADDALTAMKQLVGETERLVKIQGNFDRQVASNAEKALADAKTRLANAERRLADIDNAPGLSNRVEELFTKGQAQEDVATARQILAEAQTAAQNAQLGLSQRAVEEQRDRFAGRLTGIDEQIGAIETRRRASIDVERLAPRIRAYELRKRDAVYISDAEYQAELKRLRALRDEIEKAKQEAERKPSGEKNRTPAQVFADFKAELAERGVVQAAGRTGYRTAADQNAIFRSGESPLDGYTRRSRHQSYQALDPTRASHDDAAAHEAAQAAGLKGFKIVTESGGRKHYEWTGAGQKGIADVGGSESAERAAEQRAEKAQRNREALQSALLASKEDQARLARLGVTDATRLAELDLAAIDAGLARKLAQNAKLELDHKELDALDKANAEIEKRAVTEKLRADLAAKALDREGARIDAAAMLIEIEGQLATTTKGKKAAAEKLLGLRRDREVNAADSQFAKDGDYGAYLTGLAQADVRFNADAELLKRDFRGPTADYMAELRANVGDMDEAFDGIAARGLQSLEDGLVGLVTGTETVAGAFKRMAASILADLARIAIQKIILSAFGIGFADGDVPKFASGLISGPGTGTSDSILAWHQSMGPIRVSNGESIITAEGTRKHRRLLQAINDNTLPSFAAGMVGQVSYPSIPRAAALRVPTAAPAQYFDLRGAVVTEELYRTMHQIGAAHAAHALAAAPAMAMEDMAEYNSQRIPV